MPKDQPRPKALLDNQDLKSHRLVDPTPHGRGTQVHKKVIHNRTTRPLQPQLKTSQYEENWSYIPNAMPGDGIPDPSVYYQTSQNQPAQLYVAMLLNAIPDRPPTKPTGSEGTEFQYELYSSAKKSNGRKIPPQCY